VSDTVFGYDLLRAPSGAVALASPLLRDAVVHGFSTRVGGVSPGSFASLNFGLKGGDSPDNVRRNLERFAALVGFDADRLFRLKQVHGSRVVEVRAGDDPRAVLAEQADALVSSAPGVTLGVVTADCVPVLLVDPQAPAVGVAHAGWRGLQAGVVQAAIERMGQLYGSAPARLLAATGPCIGACCYEVGADLAAGFQGIPRAVVPRPGRRPHLDLAVAVRHVLVSAGVPGSSIAQPVGLCTHCQRELFFSYRRDGSATGHHLSVVALGATP
jgi:YfiH family protein